MGERRRGERRTIERRHSSVGKMFTYREAANFAHVSVRTIIRWVKMGKLKARYVFGRNPRIALASLQWAIDRMPPVNSSSKRGSDLISSKHQEVGAKGGVNADQRPA